MQQTREGAVDSVRPPTAYGINVLARDSGVAGPASSAVRVPVVSERPTAADSPVDARAPTPIVPPQDPRGIENLFRSGNPDLTVVHTLQDQRLDSVFSLRVVGAVEGDNPFNRGRPATGPLPHYSAYGVFVVGEYGAPYLAVDTFTVGNILDLEVAIERATDQWAIISRKGGSYGTVDERHSYAFDLGRREVLSRVEHEPLSIHTAVEAQNAMLFVGQEGSSATVVVVLRDADAYAEPGAYEIIDAFRGEPLSRIDAAVREASVVHLIGREQTYRLGLDPVEFLESRATEPLRLTFDADLAVDDRRLQRLSGPELRRQRVLWHDAAGAEREFVYFGGAMRVGRSGIYELGSAEPMFHPLPQPDFSLFAEYRRDRVAHGYDERHATLDVAIGPATHQDDRLWFGLDFYDGEGMTGIGGFGYFDLAERAYHMTYSREIAAWSASAIRVEADAIWLGLMGNPEGAPYSGGLARYDRQDSSWTTRDVLDVIHTITRRDDRLYLGTSDGIHVLEDGRVTKAGFRIGAESQRLVYTQPR